MPNCTTSQMIEVSVGLLTCLVDDATPQITREN